MRRFVFLLVVWVGAVLVLTGCAQPNDPAENTSGNYLEFVDFYATETYVGEFDVSDDYIYIAEDMAGFSIWDQSTGEMLIRMGNSEDITISNVKQIKALEENNLLLIYNRFGSTTGVRFYDINDKANPQNIASSYIMGNTSNISQMQVWSIDINRFRFSWLYDSNFYYSGEYIRPDSTSTFWYQDGITFEDNTFSNSAESYYEDRDNGRLYLASGELGMQIFDRADFSELNLISTIGQTLAVMVVDNVAFLGNREEGIQLFDISDEMNPIELFNYDTTGLASDIAVSSELNVFALASTSGGIYLFRGPAGTIERLQRLDDSEIGYTYKVMIRGNYLYAGTRYGVYKYAIINL